MQRHRLAATDQRVAMALGHASVMIEYGERALACAAVDVAEQGVERVIVCQQRCWETAGRVRWPSPTPPTNRRVAATTADQRVVYNQSTGQLFFDADGNGAGAAVLFALVVPGTALTTASFEVIAPPATTA